MNATTYLCDDGNAEVKIEAHSAREAAQEYVDGGDWHTGNTTTWITVWVTTEADQEEGEPAERHTVAIEPEEPECDEDEHDWRSPFQLVGGIEENPGVWGHGGGVVVEEVCVICGCARKIDTWAQDPTTGEQGLTAESYEEGEFDIPLHLMEMWLEGVLHHEEDDEIGETRVALVKGKWGWWGVCEIDEFSDTSCDWYRDEDEARREYTDAVDNLRGYADALESV